MLSNQYTMFVTPIDKKYFLLKTDSYDFESTFRNFFKSISLFIFNLLFIDYIEFKTLLYKKNKTQSSLTTQKCSRKHVADSKLP